MIGRATLALALALAFPARAATLYLAPIGDDNAAGTSAKAPLATLAGALSRAQQAAPGEATRVIVLPGTYSGQSVVIDSRLLHGPLTITTAPGTQRPQFMGNGTGTWLQFRGSQGKDSGLSIQGLGVTRYATAISLNGNRSDPAAFNRGTVIADLVLTQIGSDTTSGAAPSTAAIRLVNARDTVIRGVLFQTIRNTPRARCGGLHAIYLASHAIGARIEGNTFADFCGSAIKLRDDSGRATITGNTFRAPDNAPGIEEWFCDRERTEECTKPEGECPSTGIVIGPNDFGPLPFDRRILVRGSRQQRPWCAPGSASAPRFVRPDGRPLD